MISPAGMVVDESHDLSILHSPSFILLAQFSIPSLRIANGRFLRAPRGFSTQKPAIPLRTVPVLNGLFATRYWLPTTD